MRARQGRCVNRVGFIFVSSPNSVTPAHFDIEHSLLMQVSGAKTVSFGRFATEADRRHEVERYWDGSHGRIESLPPELALYPLTPGRGVYIPPIAPHWVHNGPAISPVGHAHLLHRRHRAGEHDRGAQWPSAGACT